MSDSKTRRHLMITGAVAAIAFALIVGCTQGSTPDLEARIAQLEASVATLESKLAGQQQAVALTAAATARRGSIFDSPLQRFFDAPEFWEIVVIDQGACLAGCQGILDTLEGCDGDRECESRVFNDLTKCQQSCGVGGSGIGIP